MRNISLDVGIVEAPLRRPFTTALRTTSVIRGLVVRLTTDAGVGWGAAAPTPAITGDTEDAILADLHAAASAWRGVTWDAPAEALDAVAPATGSARAALDIAAHDVWARAQGRALHELLGGARPSITTDTTISLAAPDVMAAEAVDAVARGFATLKVKLGDAAGDAARLAAVRAAAPDAVLRVDANQGWTPREAIELVTAFEADGLGVELVEQPVGRHDLDGLAQVRRAVATPILADESVFTVDDARRVLERDAADLLNVKLMKAGGLDEAAAIVDLATAAGVPCMVGAMMESTIGISAALALACGRPGVRWADLDPPLLIATEPVVGGLTVATDRLTPVAGPGLGITDVKDVTWLT